ncbi:class I SAM-dependent methyltransferase [Pseudomonadota bacterium]
MPAVELLYQAAIEILDGTPKKIAIFNAYAEPQLKTVAGQCDTLFLLQHFKPEYNQLKRMGLKCSLQIDSDVDVALLIPSKNKQQTLGWMAEAINSLVDGGKLIASCANSHGAKSYEKALKELTGNVSSSSKSKCRLFSARKSESLNRELAAQWMADASPRKAESHGLISQPGNFCWEKPDIGSQLLLKHLPHELSGRGMDLCSGYGLLSVDILKNSPDIEMLYLVEADRLALQSAELNMKPWQEKVEVHWLDAAQEALPLKLDWIVCNPPFHRGHERDITLGQAIIANGCKSLKRGGKIYMVANRKLPYEATLDRMLMQHHMTAQEQGFKIIEATKGQNREAGHRAGQKVEERDGWDFDYE